MKLLRHLSCALALAGAATLASAQTDTARTDTERRLGVDMNETQGTQVDRAFESAPKDCSEVKWSQAALDAFPAIASACQAVEERNGRTYVKLEGTVEEVRNAGKRIRVDFEDGGELTFTPTPRTTLYMDGRQMAFEEVQDGEQLNFYIPEDRLQAELQPDPNRQAFVIFPLDMDTTVIPGREQSAAQSERQARQESMTAGTGMDELPRTAGPLPLIGAGGLLLVLVAGGITLVRKLR